MSLCCRCGKIGHWTKIYGAALNIANIYKVYRKVTEAHNMEQEDDVENVKLRVNDFKDEKNDETLDFP